MKSIPKILKVVFILSFCAAWLVFAIYCWNGACELDLPGKWVQPLKEFLTVTRLKGGSFYIYLELSGFVFFTFYLSVLLPDLIGRFVPLKGKRRSLFAAVTILLICLAALISFVSCVKQSSAPKLMQWFYLNYRVDSFRMINSYLTPVSLFLIFFTWFIPVLILFFRDASRKGSFQPKHVAGCLALYVSLILLELVVGSACLVLLGIISHFYSDAVKAMTSMDQRAAVELLSCFCALILAPIIEETMFRGLMQHHLKRVLPANLAIIISAICFGLWHRDPGMIAYTFFWGIIIGFVYNATGKIRYTIILHLFGNLLEILIWSTTNKAILGKRLFLPAYRQMLMGLPVILGIFLFLMLLLFIFVLIETLTYFATEKENTLTRFVKRRKIQ